MQHQINCFFFFYLKFNVKVDQLNQSLWKGQNFGKLMYTPFKVQFLWLCVLRISGDMKLLMHLVHVFVWEENVLRWGVVPTELDAKAVDQLFQECIKRNNLHLTQDVSWVVLQWLSTMEVKKYKILTQEVHKNFLPLFRLCNRD